MDNEICIIDKDAVGKSRKAFNCDLCKTEVPAGNKYTVVYKFKNTKSFSYPKKYRLCSKCDNDIYGLHAIQHNSNNDINLFIKNKLGC